MRLSVVIPTYERPAALTGALEALCAQTYPRERFEVIVVDNAGGAETVVRPFEARLPVRALRETRRGPAAARNTGARAARGTLLAFTDDDCRPAPEWLAALAEAASAAPGALIGGRTVDLPSPSGMCTRASRLVLDYFCERQNADPARPRFFPSNNLAVPKEAFETIGGFDASFPRAAGEDRDLCERWRAAGRPLVHAPQALVRHAHALAFRSFVRQQVSYGRGAFRFRAAGPGRPLGPPAFYAGLLACPFRHAGPVRGAALAGLVLVSQAAVAAGYVSERLAGLTGLKALRAGGGSGSGAA